MNEALTQDADYIEGGGAVRKTYCKHYHIDCGESQCWAVASRLGATTIEQIRRYARPAGCDGQKSICDFKKFGVKEKQHERNQTHRPV